MRLEIWLPFSFRLISLALTVTSFIVSTEAGAKDGLLVNLCETHLFHHGSCELDPLLFAMVFQVVAEILYWAPWSVGHIVGYVLSLLALPAILATLTMSYESLVAMPNTTIPVIMESFDKPSEWEPQLVVWLQLFSFSFYSSNLPRVETNSGRTYSPGTATRTTTQRTSRRNLLY